MSIRNASPTNAAAEVIRQMGPEALPHASVEAKNAIIDCDAERACFWMLVKARIANGETTHA